MSHLTRGWKYLTQPSLITIKCTMRTLQNASRIPKSYTVLPWRMKKSFIRNKSLSRVLEIGRTSPKSKSFLKIQPSDSVSQHGSSFVAKGSHRSNGYSSSPLSVKIKVAKAEKAVAQLKLHQLKKKIELQQKRDAVQREQDLLEQKTKKSEQLSKHKS